ncbi:MAG TPA: hypothetical protein VG406_11845, partial [Isosphaeraceae bacterium]|nr:hypothetical protein [Isosphaeraceae bacterium]
MGNRPDRRVTVRFEQAVYGSFPFWDRGYDLLAHSPGCRPEWLAELKTICQGYGERPLGAAGAGGLFATQLRSGPWLVVGPAEQGLDDRGRPGAVAFHALFVEPRAYRKTGFDPFAFLDQFRRDWTSDIHTLPAGEVALDAIPPVVAIDDRASRIAAAIARGSRVALQANEPIDELARMVWHALPPRVRKRASLATWAFGNARRYDLVALPRLAGVALDPSYIDPATLDVAHDSPGSIPGATGCPQPMPAGVAEPAQVADNPWPPRHDRI